MLYGLPIPILPTQPKRWNQHSLLKRIPSDSLFEEFALAGLCHGQRVERREQDRLANVYDENGAQHASKFDQVGVPRPQYSIVILICSGCLSGIAALRR